MNKEKILKEHYKDIGKLGGSATKKKYGVEYLRRLGKKGGLLGGRPKGSKSKKLST